MILSDFCVYHSRHGVFETLSNVLGSWLLEPCLNVHGLKAGVDQEALQKFKPRRLANGEWIE